MAKTTSFAEAATSAVESKANESQFAAARAKLDGKAEAEQHAGEVAVALKMALEKANIRTNSFFADVAGAKMTLGKPEFVKKLKDLGVKFSDVELGDVFNVWDRTGAGTLDLKDVDRVIRAAKLTGSMSSAKEIQRALNERLTGKMSKGKKDDKKAADTPPPKVKAKSKKEVAKDEEVVVEYDEDVEAPEGTWAASKWLNSLGVSKVITRALCIPSAAVKPAFDFVRGLSEDDMQQRLVDAKLDGLVECLIGGLRELKKIKFSGSAALNDKFSATGKFQMSYGSLSLFYGGLESLLGPPQMARTDTSDPDSLATLLKSMENDHCAMPDSAVLFKTPNGMEAISKVEWEFVNCPRLTDYEDVYPERDGIREANPEWCRKPMSMERFLERMEAECNIRLRKENHSELIVEEIVGGRLYTGPMYAKYNAVLRAKSKVPFLVGAAKDLTMGNDYTTTIHAINSCVLKLSKLTKACNVYRGIKDAMLPKEFWVPNELGVRGGIEYGFSSTTTDKAQAVLYASAGAKPGDAMTIFEMRMGMVDRGADLSWLSQYPHEREVLLPPLTGVEALHSDVEGNMLVIQSRFSLNLSAQTLEQVLSRRRKMLMDMAYGIELDLREALPENLIGIALKILRKALEYGAYSFTPEWFNNDDNFAKVMQETLYLQRILVDEIKKLDAAMSKTDLNLRSWKVRSPARIMLVCGWVMARHNAEKNIDLSIDLRECELQPHEGVQLAKLLRDMPKLTGLDLRGNESLGEEGVADLEAFMKTCRVTNSQSVAHSLCGITPANSRLEIPKIMEPIDLRLICAELEASAWAEGVSSAMGAKVKGSSQLNRRSGTHQTGDQWKPLLWAAKENQRMVADVLLDHGFNVNEQEPTTDKSLSGYVPLHWAAHKGHKEMLQLLLARGAAVGVKDKHGNCPKELAQKKGFKEIVELLEEAEKKQAKMAKDGTTKEPKKPTDLKKMKTEMPKAAETAE